MNKISSGSDYRFNDNPCHANHYLFPPIINILQKKGAKKVLDLGCGNGFLSKTLSDLGMEVVGIDPSQSGIDNCKKLLPNNKFYCMGIYDDPSKIVEDNFDAVVSTEVIEHLFYPRELPRFAFKKLAEKGLLILTTPYHGYIKNLTLSLLNKWDSHISPFWDGGHIKFWSAATLTQLVEEEGFNFLDFKGCGRLPYLWKSMLIVCEKK